MSDPIVERLNAFIDMWIRNPQREQARVELSALLADVAIEYHTWGLSRSDIRDQIRARFGIVVASEQPGEAKA